MNEQFLHVKFPDVEGILYYIVMGAAAQHC